MRKLICMIAAFVFCISFTGAEEKASAAPFSVNANQVYTYDVMKKDLEALAAAYPHLVSYKSVGKSEYGRELYAVSIGKGPAQVFVNGSHHAREWMTTSLNMKMIDQYAKAYYSNTSINGLSAKSILDNTTIWFMPMVNPDGVSLQQYGVKALPASSQSSALKMNGGSSDFKHWKANAKGVDLNRQYDAKWSSICCSPGKPASENFKGYSPASTAETKVVLGFMKNIDPEMSLSYHSSGEILFWNFYQTGARYTRDLNYAKQLGRMTGYRLVYPGPNPSGGGFTDWFLESYKRPAFTLEISPFVGDTSVPLKNFSKVWEENKDVGLYAAKESYKLYQQRIGSKYDQQVSQVNSYLQSSFRLKPYYTANIKSQANLYISASMKKLYDQSDYEVKKAEQIAAELPAYYKENAMKNVRNAKQTRLQAAYFIDAVKVGDLLNKERGELQSFVNNGTLNDETGAAYDELSRQLNKEEASIGKVYGSSVRSLFGQKYLVPAKIAKETVIYEISRYRLLAEIKELKANGTNPDILNEKFNLYDRLTERSAAVKKAGNQLYPGKYPDLPGFETTLKQIENELR
ncbi:peptidase M14 [Metabacillus sp. KIGAM252]|uniref:Peptidase M14 n=1 Tax=Metabacillus flavus TaxID=2823519 RepID=A0ABS5LIY6_9BACI|nr:peptidase M14 [Metabacillus flavus]